MVIHGHWFWKHLGTGSMVVTDVLQWRRHHCPIILEGRHSISDFLLIHQAASFFSTLRLINDTTMCSVDGHLFFGFPLACNLGSGRSQRPCGRKEAMGGGHMM
jgi:hypothetical protein